MWICLCTNVRQVMSRTLGSCRHMRKMMRQKHSNGDEQHTVPAEKHVEVDSEEVLALSGGRGKGYR